MSDDSDRRAAAGPLKELMQRYLRHSIDDMARLLQDHALSMPQVAALQCLRAEGPQSVTEIAGHLNLSLAATSHLVDRLVQRDVLARQEDPSDRRRKRVSIDRQGRALLSELDRRATESLQALLEPVSAARERRGRCPGRTGTRGSPLLSAANAPDVARRHVCQASPTPAAPNPATNTGHATNAASDRHPAKPAADTQRGKRRWSGPSANAARLVMA